MLDLILFLALMIVVVIILFIALDFFAGAAGGGGRLWLALKGLIILAALVFVLQRQGLVW